MAVALAFIAELDRPSERARRPRRWLRSERVCLCLAVAGQEVISGSPRSICSYPIAKVSSHLTRGNLEAKLTGPYLAATAPASEAGERVSAAAAEVLRGAVQPLIGHAERLRAKLMGGRGVIAT